MAPCLLWPGSHCSAVLLCFLLCYMLYGKFMLWGISNTSFYFQMFKCMKWLLLLKQYCIGNIYIYIFFYLNVHGFLIKCISFTWIKLMPYEYYGLKNSFLIFWKINLYIYIYELSRNAFIASFVLICFVLKILLCSVIIKRSEACEHCYLTWHCSHRQVFDSCFRISGKPLKQLVSFIFSYFLKNTE